MNPLENRDPHTADLTRGAHSRMRTPRLMRYPALWLALLTAVVYAMGVVPYWKPTWDSAIYISLARALVEGNGYTYMGYPHTKYPPGFPLLMAPVVALAGVWAPASGPNARPRSASPHPIPEYFMVLLGFGYSLSTAAKLYPLSP